MAIVQNINNLGGANVSLSPFLQPANTPTILNGCNISYRLGAIQKDCGYERIGDAASAVKPITGLFDFRQSSSVQKILRTRNDDTGANLLLQYNNAGTWTNINVGSTYDAYEDTLTEMEGFLGYCFIVGYDSTDNVWLPPASLTGTTFSTSVNVTSMPSAKYIKRYRDRLYTLNLYYGGTAYPYRVGMSSVPVAGAIAWTATDFLDVDFSEAGTGLGCLWDKLLVFTEKSAYMYDQTQFKKVWDIGGYHRTICNHKSTMYFAGPDGLNRSTGGDPETISDPIFQLWKTSDPSKWTASIVDEEYNWYLGACNANGVNYTNCLATFNIPTQTWRWRELYHSVSILTPYLSSGIRQLYMGTTIGEVYRKGKYTDSTLLTSDAGNPIGSYFELAPIFLGNLSFQKNVTKITTFAERAMGLKLKARVVDRSARVLTPYTELGECVQYVQHHHINMKSGVLLQIAGYEYGSNPYWSFLGFDFELENVSEVLS